MANLPDDELPSIATHLKALAQMSSKRRAAILTLTNLDA